MIILGSVLDSSAHKVKLTVSQEKTQSNPDLHKSIEFNKSEQSTKSEELNKEKDLKFSKSN